MRTLFFPIGIALVWCCAQAAATGTWTYYSTTTVTVTPTTTTQVVGRSRVVIQTTVTDPKVSTITTVRGTIVATKKFYTSTLTKTIGPTNPVRTYVPLGSSFTPIRSEFAYTAPVEIVRLTSTITTVGREYSWVDTLTTTQTTLIRRTTTVADPTAKPTPSTYFLFGVTTITTTKILPATVYTFAACETGSGNYADVFPWSKPINRIVPDDFGQKDGLVYSLQPSRETYFVKNYDLTNAKDCCNLALSYPLAAFGSWQPTDSMGRSNVCYIFLVQNQTVCDPSAVQYSFVDAEYDNSANSTYSVFNGVCGRATPDHHGRLYYVNGGAYEPEQS